VGSRKPSQVSTEEKLWLGSSQTSKKTVRAIRIKPMKVMSVRDGLALGGLFKGAVVMVCSIGILNVA
jgi:hypothetical protein